MGNERSFTWDVVHAVLASNLPPNLRHFLITLAALANSQTGSAYYGQDKIAAAMGISARQVRKNLEVLGALDERGATPVRVVRQHRGTPDGKGRSSDIWTLVLTSNAPVLTGTPVPVEAPLTGTPVPLNAVPTNPPLPELCDSSTGTLEQLNRNSSSADLRRDLRRDNRRSSKRSKSEPKTDSRVPELWAHYHAEHERLRGVTPVFTNQQRGAVGKSWKSMLEAITLEDARAVITRALTDGFHVQPTAILANLNKYRGRQPTRGKPPVAAQRGVSDEAAAARWGKDKADKLTGAAE